MCHQSSCTHLSAEEAISAEERLLLYCKPVELYNILHRRAQHNPLFLQRCLHYNIQERRNRELRPGIVIFNYRDYSNMLQKVEVTEDFSCPFCLIQSSSFKGLRYHLCSSHDLFNFEFWLKEEYQAVNVSVKLESLRSEIAMAQSSVDREYVKAPCASDPALPATKMRKLSIERSESKSRMLLQKRQFYHSHRVQPMALEQVISDRDSEDEVDDDIADLEDRRMLDDFVDVSKDEKQLMHLWNSFVRKQRVLADGHVPWACEAFSKLHGKELVLSPALFWCWRLFMIKLWNHGLLDAGTIDNCNTILERVRCEGREAAKGYR
ncbi:polycomb group protein VERNALIZATION 2-like [Carica papaya]|uniref:polycomb group protein VERNALIZATION 2-like n=1 Tax=Carica papaya TaxID=3649 RepID=UPI000B8CBA17|nr:polycomb group protein VERNALIZATION 2-like [Carica papaya]